MALVGRKEGGGSHQNTKKKDYPRHTDINAELIGVSGRKKKKLEGVDMEKKGNLTVTSEKKWDHREKQAPCFEEGKGRDCPWAKEKRQLPKRGRGSFIGEWQRWNGILAGRREERLHANGIRLIEKKRARKSVWAEV